MRRPKDAPENWVYNVKKEHAFEKHYDSRGHIFQEEQCHCVQCLKECGAWEDNFYLGDPVPVHDSFPLDALLKRGIFGVYRG